MSESTFREAFTPPVTPAGLPLIDFDSIQGQGPDYANQLETYLLNLNGRPFVYKVGDRIREWLPTKSNLAQLRHHCEMERAA